MRLVMISSRGGHFLIYYFLSLTNLFLIATTVPSVHVVFESVVELCVVSVVLWAYFVAYYFVVVP